MSESGQGDCRPYEITKVCYVGDIECQPKDVVCLSPSEHEFLLSEQSVEAEPSTKDLTRRRPESSGCAQCGSSL